MLMQKAVDGRTQHVAWRHRRMDGRLFEAEVTLTAHTRQGKQWILTVHSAPGRGGTFKVFLPVSAAPDAPEPTNPPPPESVLTGAETILLVEDEEIFRELAFAILEGKGYTVLAATRADEALERMARHEGPIHLLLTDVILPGMSAQRLHQRVSAVDPEIRVLYMSGYTDDIIAPHGMLDPGGQSIQKPFSARALAEKVRGALAG